MKKEKRTHYRYLLSDLLCVTASNRDGMFSVHDISMGGAFLLQGPSQFVYAPQVELTVRLQLPGSLHFLEIPGKVIRVRWHGMQKGFAVQWDTMPKKLADTLNAWITYQKNMQIIKVSRKIIEDFYGGPK